MRATTSVDDRLVFLGCAGALVLLTLVPTTRVVVSAAAAGFDGLWTPISRTALLHTLVVSIAGAIIAGALGGGFALLLGTTDLPHKGPLASAFCLLMILPSQVTTIAWITLLGPSSVVLAPLGLAPALGQPNALFGPGGISFLLGLEYAPLVFIVLRSGLRSVPREAIRAAQACGAGPWRCLWRVASPLAAPALLAGMALAFVSCLGTFGAPALLGIPGRYVTLPTLIYQRLTAFGTGGLASAATLSLLLVMAALAGMAAEGWFGRRLRSTARGPGMDGPIFHLGRCRGVAAAAGWSLVLLLIVVPLAALFGTALAPALGVSPSLANLTLDNFRYVLFGHDATRRALGNSFLLGAMSAVLLGSLAIPTCYYAIWRGSRTMGWLLRGADLAYALPGTVLALAAILLFIRPVMGIALYDTLGIQLIAYLARFLTLAQRPVAAAFRVLDPELERAAQSSGARLGPRLSRVVLPLVAPAAVAGALMVFLTAFNELTVSALLWSSGHETVGVVMFSLQQAGEAPLAAAMAVISAASVVALMTILSLLARRLPRFVLPWG